MKQGIIFDMDGTLWDSTVGVAESWNEILKQEKVNRTPLTVEDFRGIMGKTMDVIAAKFFPDMPEKERMELLDKCGEYENTVIKAPMSKDSSEYKEFVRIYNNETKEGTL